MWDVLLPKAQERLASYLELVFRDIDRMLHPSINGQLLVFAAPTLVMFREGHELKRFRRNMSMRGRQSFLEQIAQRASIHFVLPL